MSDVYEKNKKRILIALEKAERFYKEEISAIGGCDHSVGICICDIIAESNDLSDLLKEIKGE
jgi:hypothetical protein